LKAILKLLVAVVVLNAVYHAGMTTYNHFQLRDRTERLIRFDNTSTPEELETLIIGIGSRLGIPLTTDDVDVTRQGPSTTASASYTAVVEYFPNYTYARPVSFSVTVFSTGPLKPGATP
jgi:hypothetical protein